jgi:predicted  nucleic acid-binding Zn-ribbon protein
MTVAADLFALQETDIALDKARIRLAEIEEKTGESEGLASARGWLDAITDRVRQLRSTQSDLEFEADEVRIKATEVEQKLYSGRVTNPKELSDLDADLKSLKTNLLHKEDALLAQLEEVEAAEAALARAQSTFEAMEAAWQAGQSHLVAEKAELEPEIERLQARSVEQAAGIDRAPLSLYRLLRERRNGEAVAGVERGMCQGCRITLPTGVIQRARMPGALVQCVSCERILVFQ